MVIEVINSNSNNNNNNNNNNSLLYYLLIKISMLKFFIKYRCVT